MQSVEFDSAVIRSACEEMLGKIESDRVDAMVDIATQMYAEYQAKLVKINRRRRWTLRKPIEQLGEEQFFHMLRASAEQAEPGTHPIHAVYEYGQDLEQDVKSALVMARYTDRSEIELPLLRAFHACGITLSHDRAGGGARLGFIR